MEKIEKLKTILTTDVLIELAENIDELEQQLAKKSSKALKEELAYMKNAKKYFDEVLEDIKHGTLKQADAHDILESLEEMRTDNEDDF